MKLEILNVVIGLGVIVLNLIPLVLRRYKYLIVTAILSLILMYIGNLIS